MTDIFNARQRMISAALMEIVHEVGKFDWTVGANGAHYVPASENPFLPQNIRCEECVFYADGDGCAIVGGEIESNAVCKFWTIPEQEITQEMPVSDEAPMDEVPMDEVPMDEMKVDLSTAERDALPDEDFAIPSSRNFPIDSPAAISDAVSSWGRYEGDVSFETFKRNLIAIAIRKGQDYVDALPQAWRDEMQKHIVMTAKRYLAFLDS